MEGWTHEGRGFRGGDGVAGVWDYRIRTPMQVRALEEGERGY